MYIQFSDLIDPVKSAYIKQYKDRRKVHLNTPTHYEMILHGLRAVCRHKHCVHAQS